MHAVIPDILWIGHAGDLRTPAAIEQAGIRAIVQLALAEPIPSLSRELLIAHIPLMDGPGNAPAMIAAAIDLTASLIRSSTRTLLCCSAGMSRSPAIAAGAISVARGMNITEALRRVVNSRPHDLSPAVWDSVCEVVESRRSGHF